MGSGLAPGPAGSGDDLGSVPFSAAAEHGAMILSVLASSWPTTAAVMAELAAGATAT